MGGDTIGDNLTPLYRFACRQKKSSIVSVAVSRCLARPRCRFVLRRHRRATHGPGLQSCRARHRSHFFRTHIPRASRCRSHVQQAAVSNRYGEPKTQRQSELACPRVARPQGNAWRLRHLRSENADRPCRGTLRWQPADRSAGICIHSTRNRCDSGDLVGQFACQPVGHHGSV